jgi:PAS domain-containing protein
MRDSDRIKGSPSTLARKVLVSASTLALAGAGIGVFEILRGVAASEEMVIVLSGGVFAISVLTASLIFPRVPAQPIATAATAFYTIYLCSGIFISLFCHVDHQILFVYLIWFFPLLLFNRLVNSPAMGKSFAKVILIAPLAVLGCLSFKMIAIFGATSIYIVVVFCLSFAFFGVMLNLITRYREAYIAERAHAESLRVESEVLESISDCFISLNSEFKLVYLNDAACSELGVERQTALNGAILSVIPGFFSDAMLAGLKAASLKDSASVFEAQNEQQSRWYEMRCFPRPGRISIYFRNITD